MTSARTEDVKHFPSWFRSSSAVYRIFASPQNLGGLADFIRAAAIKYLAGTFFLPCMWLRIRRRIWQVISMLDDIINNQSG